MRRYFSNQHKQIRADLSLRLDRIFKKFNFILGDEVLELENKLQKLTKSRHVIGTSSGTDALVVALMAIKIKPKDEVITTPFSWISTAEAIKLVGAQPVYVDIDPTTFNIDYKKIKEKISKKTKAILPVSLFGLPCDISEIKKITKNKNIKIIEDGAQSFGAKIGKKYSSNFADIFCTSFFPTKPLGCYGDGGACFTNSKILAKRMKLLRNHCQVKKNIHNGIGLNARLDTIQAAVLLSKIKIFEKEIFLRNKVVESIKKGLSRQKTDLKFQKIKKNFVSANAQLPMMINNRTKFLDNLKRNKINFSIFYPKPIYKQIGYNEKKYFLKNVEKVCKEILCLQVDPYMSKKEVKTLVNKIVKF